MSDNQVEITVLYMDVSTLIAERDALRAERDGLATALAVANDTLGYYANNKNWVASEPNPRGGVPISPAEWDQGEVAQCALAGIKEAAAAAGGKA